MIDRHYIARLLWPQVVSISLMCLLWKNQCESACPITYCYLEFDFPCDESAAEKSVVAPMFMEASAALMAKGAYFNRPYGLWAEMVYSRYTEGVTVLRKLKGIFDPNNILNPGKLCF